MSLLRARAMPANVVHVVVDLAPVRLEMAWSSHLLLDAITMRVLFPRLGPCHRGLLSDPWV